MGKKGFGKAVALAVIAGAAAAGISYFRKYQSFNKELDEDFHDYEDDEDDAPLPDSTMTRNYVSLHADKDEFLIAASDMLDAAKDVAGAAKNVLKDAAAIMADTTREAVNAAGDTASAAKNSFNARKSGKNDMEDIFEDDETDDFKPKREAYSDVTAGLGDDEEHTKPAEAADESCPVRDEEAAAAEPTEEPEGNAAETASTVITEDPEE